MVFHADGDGIASFQAAGPIKLGDFIGALIELTISNDFARSGHDNSRLVGILLGMQIGMHRLTLSN